MRAAPSMFLLGLAAWMCSGCFAYKPWVADDAPGLDLRTGDPGEQLMPPEGTLQYRLFLIGDAGKWPASEHTVRALRESTAAFPARQTTVLFLGDNIYPAGMPPEDHKDRHHAEEILGGQVEILADFDGQLLYLPGNHDWNEGRADGLEWVQRQDAWFDEHRAGNVLRPDEGCPGPEVLRLADGLVLVILDSQWWLEQHKYPEGINPDCVHTDKQRWLQGLEAVLAEHRDETVVVSAHHPLYSNGEHGGRFPATDHFFPFRKAHKALWVPLPVLGSVYPILRKSGVAIQDIPHTAYSNLRDSLTTVLATHPRVLYASGHEHTLQLLEHEGIPFVVSGSGAKTSAVRKGLEARFAYGGQGFARLDWWSDGTLRLWFFAVSGEGEAKPVYVEDLMPVLPAEPDGS